MGGREGGAPPPKSDFGEASGVTLLRQKHFLLRQKRYGGQHGGRARIGLAATRGVMADGKWQMAQAPTKDATKASTKEPTRGREGWTHMMIQPALERLRAEGWRRALAQVRAQVLFSTWTMKRR